MPLSGGRYGVGLRVVWWLGHDNNIGLAQSRALFAATKRNPILHERLMTSGGSLVSQSSHRDQTAAHRTEIQLVVRPTTSSSTADGGRRQRSYAVRPHSILAIKRASSCALHVPAASRSPRSAPTHRAPCVAVAPAPMESHWSSYRSHERGR